MSDDLISLTVVPVVKAGRCADGYQRGHGKLIHAMFSHVYHPNGAMGAALCGTTPGRRSVGFYTNVSYRKITCKRCLSKLNKLQKSHGVIVHE